MNRIMELGAISKLPYFFYSPCIYSIFVQKEDSLISQKWLNEIAWNLVQIIIAPKQTFQKVYVVAIATH
jgi:hypothetical protein